VKKRIIIGLACFTSIFFLGGIYIIGSIQRATSTLDNLIKLHQVQILRDQLLIAAKRTQSDLAYKDTRYSEDIEKVIGNVVVMAGESKKCSECHHTAEVAARIADLEARIDAYEDSLSRLLTMRAGRLRLAAEQDRALKIGQELTDKLDSMVFVTKAELEKKTRSSLRDIGEMKTLLFALISAGPILAICLAIVFIKGFTGPVDAILQATRKVKAGDLAFRIEGLKDEFGEVADSFNEMAASLNEQMQNLQRAEQMKMVGEMAAGLVHEIKNPLTGIKATMQVLIEQGSCGREDRVVLSKVMEEVKRIETLMKSLLDFAKPPRPQLMPVDINEVLESTLAFSIPYSGIASSRGKSIEVKRVFDPHLPMIPADPGQMRQVFLNLLMNALEAMPEGGVLTVRTSGAESAEEIRIDVADTGKGIDDETGEKIFRPFFTTKHKGTGLGLAVTKGFVEMHGGTIGVEKNPGGGTIFRIRLPGKAATDGAGRERIPQN
jgi:signal transduction histidine kinase